VVKRGGEGEVAAVAARTTGAPGGRQWPVAPGARPHLHKVASRVTVPYN
jgi:hypothetical protein